MKCYNFYTFNQHIAEDIKEIKPGKLCFYFLFSNYSLLSILVSMVSGNSIVVRAYNVFPQIFPVPSYAWNTLYFRQKNILQYPGLFSGHKEKTEELIVMLFLQPLRSPVLHKLPNLSQDQRSSLHVSGYSDSAFLFTWSVEAAVSSKRTAKYQRSAIVVCF